MDIAFDVRTNEHSALLENFTNHESWRIIIIPTTNSDGKKTRSCWLFQKQNLIFKKMIKLYLKKKNVPKNSNKENKVFYFRSNH